jgi:hypothetical protein
MDTALPFRSFDLGGISPARVAITAAPRTNAALAVRS